MQNINYKNTSLTPFDDDQQFILKEILEVLQSEFLVVNCEKNDLEKQLSCFHHRYTLEVGAMLLQILTLQKLLYNDDEQRKKEVEEQEYVFREQFQRSKNIKIKELNVEEQNEIKKKFRKASFLCHPDIVSSENKEIAQQIFIDLKKAYDNNELEKVTEILNNLETDTFFNLNKQQISEIDKLMLEIQKLKTQIKEINKYIDNIKKSETYQIIINIENWDKYFVDIKEQLFLTLHKLKNEVLKK